jgi:non-specific serine/threonine protein kinase
MPEQLGSFRVLGQIGRGGMGVVYRAHDDRLDRDVAIKAVAPELAGDPDRLARFQREARIIAQLNHPHIAQIHQVLEHEGTMYLVLEYVPGRTLASLIDDPGQRGLDRADALKLCSQVARAMEAAHALGIVHRDLKPDNVRVTDDGTAKVLDFGLALAAREQSPQVATDGETVVAAPGRASTARGAMLGTPGYMSPEQARGGEVDARADIFSFGCLLFECLSGERAFRGSSTADLIAACMRDDPAWSCLPTSLPESISSLLRRCLVRDPDRRLHSIADARIALEEAMGERPSTPAQPPVERSPEGPNNLPRQRTRFFGRQRQLDELAAALDESQLITLTGSGGCGKTRLALELGRRLLSRFGDGVYLVELAPTASGELVPYAVGTAIGVREQSGDSIVQSLEEHLASRRMLLILDNCEHVLEPSADLAAALLDASPDSRIVATSREPLGVEGERTWRVPSLSLPETRPRQRGTPASGSGRARTPTPSNAPAATIDLDAVAHAEAVALFLDRAKAAKPAFALTDSNVDGVVSICRRLDGIPLAIELAAARVKVLTPEQIEQHLDDRFRLLSSGARGAVERHRTLRAAVEWSYRLLEETEQRTLRALSVFAGGCTLDAAMAICSGDGGPDQVDMFEVLDLLTRLGDKSLLVTDISGDEARYRLLDTVRQFAHEELEQNGEAHAARDLHLRYYRSLAEQAEAHFDGAEEAAWVERLEPEAENVLAALGWAASSTTEIDGSAVHGLVSQGLELGGWLLRFWEARGQYGPIRSALATLLTLSEHAEPSARALGLRACSALAWPAGDLETAQRDAEQAEKLYRELGDEASRAACLNTLGIVAYWHADLEGARARFEEVSTIKGELGDDHGRAGALANLGLVAYRQDDLTTARDRLEQALAIFRQLGVTFAVANNLINLAHVARRQSRPDEASQLLLEAIMLASQLRISPMFGEILDQMTAIADVTGQFETAARFAGMADVLYEHSGMTREAHTADERDEHIASARSALGSETAWQTAFDSGATLSPDAAITEAKAWLEAAQQARQ